MIRVEAVESLSETGWDKGMVCIPLAFALRRLRLLRKPVPWDVLYLSTRPSEDMGLLVSRPLPSPDLGQLRVRIAVDLHRWRGVRPPTSRWPERGGQK